MPLLETIPGLYGTAIGTASGLKDFQDYLQGRLKVEDVLTELVHDGFLQHLPRLEHLCPQGKPTFDQGSFKTWLLSDSLSVTKQGRQVQDLVVTGVVAEV
jgi:hypothetical protein